MTHVSCSLCFNPEHGGDHKQKHGIASGKRTKNIKTYGKSPFLDGSFHYFYGHCLCRKL